MIIKQKQINRQSLPNSFFFLKKSIFVFLLNQMEQKDIKLVVCKKLYLILLLKWFCSYMLIKRKCRDYMLLPSMQKVDFTIKSRLNISWKYFIHDVFILCNLFPDVWLDFTAKTRVLCGQTKCIWYCFNMIKILSHFVLLPSYEIVEKHLIY